MANSRSINNTLDSTQVNGSANIFWTANYTNEYNQFIQFLQGVGMFVSSPSVRGWACMYRQGDNVGITPAFTVANANSSTVSQLQNYPSSSGTKNSPPETLDGTIGTWVQSFTNTGLRHRAHQVQMMKGFDDNNGNVSTFEASGGSNLPAVWEQTGTYVTSNIKFSDFRGFKKAGDGGAYDYSDGADEELHSTGKIQIGTQGQGSVGA